MRRTFVLTVSALTVAVLAGAAPTTAAPTRTGTIAFGVSSPQVPRVLHLAGDASGRTGYVFDLPAGADGKTYTLTKTGPGSTGRENLDVWFYTSIGGVGAPCDFSISSSRPMWEPEDVETGAICPRADQTAAYAVVVLNAGGGNAPFSLAW